MALHKEYKWERYWCLANESYNLADGGFLVDPASPMGKFYNSNAAKFHELPDARCLALLGEPGIGKTKAIESAYRAYYAENPSHTVWLDLRSYTTDVGLRTSVESNSQISDWVKSDYQLNLFFDSLDEVKLNVKTAAAILVDIIRTWPLKRLRVRFACRTADWPTLLDSELSPLFGLEKIPKYELLPLTRNNVLSAAFEEGIDGKQFIEVLENADAVAFAIRPITLKFLFASYKKNGRLSSSKSEIYQEGCLQLCEETNSSRIDSKLTRSLTPAQRLIVASRIAAILAFSNRSAVWTGTVNDVSEGDVTIHDLSGYSEKTNLTSFAVGESEIREALGTGLFNLRGEQRLAFSHYSYMEYLAASYLNIHKVPVTEMLRLISHSDKKIIPQLNEVAAWLAAINPSIFKKLVETEPNLLLRTDKEVITEKQRRITVKKLLSEYQRGNQIDVFSSTTHFANICYSNISKELRHFIRDRRKKDEARLVAILIARECEVTDLLNDLVYVALDWRDNILIRKYAAFTVVEIGEEIHKGKLISLLRENTGKDSDDELRGIGLRAVWPNHISLDEFLASITPLKNPSLFGEYYRFISQDFAPGVKIDKLPEILTWLLEGKPGLGSETLEENLIGHISLLSWQNIENPDIAKLFSKLIYRQMIGHQLYRGLKSDISFLDEIASQPNKRRILADHIVEFLSTPQDAFYLTYYTNPILILEDIDWVIDKIRNDKRSKRKIWSQVLHSLVLQNRDDDNIEKAYNLSEEMTEVHEAFSHIFSPIQLDSEDAQSQRKYYFQALELEKPTNINSQYQIDYDAKLVSLLKQFDEGNVDAWWMLNLVILQSEKEIRRVHEFTADLTEFGLWMKLDGSTQEQVISAGRKYLVLRKPEKIWLSKNQVSRPAIAAFRAFYLLFSVAPKELEQLQPEQWNKWAQVLLSFPVYDQSEDTYDLAIHQAVVEKMLSFQIEELPFLIREEFYKDHTHIFELFENVYSNKLDEVFLEVLGDEGISQYALVQALNFLLKRRNAKTKAVAFRILEIYLQSKGTNSVQVNGIVNSLIWHTEDACWPELKKMVRKNPDFGRNLFLALSHQWDNLAKIFVQKITAPEVEELFIWLEKEFPQTKDPEFKGEGMHTITNRERVGHFRNQLIVELAGKSTRESCQALQRIEKRFPEKKWIAHYRHSCEENLRRNTWQPLSPQSIIELVQNSAKIHTAKKNNIRKVVKYSLQGLLLIVFTIGPNLIDADKNPLLEQLASNQIIIIGVLLIAIVIQLVKEFLEEK